MADGVRQLITDAKRLINTALSALDEPERPDRVLLQEVLSATREVAGQFGALRADYRNLQELIMSTKDEIMAAFAKVQADAARTADGVTAVKTVLDGVRQQVADLKAQLEQDNGPITIEQLTDLDTSIAASADGLAAAAQPGEQPAPPTG